MCLTLLELLRIKKIHCCRNSETENKRNKHKEYETVLLRASINHILFMIWQMVMLIATGCNK